MERRLEVDKWDGSLLVNGPYLLARSHLKEVGGALHGVSERGGIREEPRI